MTIKALKQAQKEGRSVWAWAPAVAMPARGRIGTMQESLGMVEILFQDIGCVYGKGEYHAEYVYPTQEAVWEARQENYYRKMHPCCGGMSYQQVYAVMEKGLPVYFHRGGYVHRGHVQKITTSGMGRYEKAEVLAERDTQPEELWFSQLYPSGRFAETAQKAWERSRQQMMSEGSYILGVMERLGLSLSRVKSGLRLIVASSMRGAILEYRLSDPKEYEIAKQILMDLRNTGTIQLLWDEGTPDGQEENGQEEIDLFLASDGCLLPVRLSTGK